MNKYCEKSFDKIKGAASAYKREVTSALDRYRQTMEAAATEAQQFKDETGFLAAKKASATTAARNSITVAENNFTSITKAEISVLRDELCRHVSAVPSDNFINLIRIYGDFGIIPSRMELDNLVAQAGNNTLSFRVLNTMLGKVNSPYRVEYQDTAALEADIAALERLATEPVMYSPDGLHPAAVDVFGGTPRLVRLVAGEPLTDHGFRWDNTSLITASTAFESAVAALDTMAERWNSSVPPKVYDAQVYADHRDEQTGAEISGAAEFVRDNTAPTGRVAEDQDVGARYAGKMAKQQAAQDSKAREMLRQYAGL